jgi:hypothetical protein
MQNVSRGRFTYFRVARSGHNGGHMAETSYQGRRAVSVENEHLRVTVLLGGGHIAEVYEKSAGVSPLWIPPWKSIEPDEFDRSRPCDYGDGADNKLLGTVMGHNLCLDIFGGPSEEEAAAGLTPHGEGSIVSYNVAALGHELRACAHFPLAHLHFERRIELHDRAILIRETVENLDACDRPIAWTQHVTLGPPFLEPGKTEFRVSATRSRVFEGRFGAADYLVPSADFDWPMAPRSSGGVADLRTLPDVPSSSAYTAHLMDPRRDEAYFVAYSPKYRLAFGYVWKRRDFPWLGIWEENHSRVAAPWNGRTLARGMEFGVSPMPESRRSMIARGQLFDVPTFRWIPARSRVTADYWIVVRREQLVPESLEWPI